MNNLRLDNDQCIILRYIEFKLQNYINNNNNCYYIENNVRTRINKFIIIRT